MEERSQQGERINQKRRTRLAILHAASGLLGLGSVPTVAEAADRAGVSRATAYRYFPSQELLLAEAALDAVVPNFPAMLAAPELENDAEAALVALVRAIAEMTRTHEAAFRALLRLSLHAGDEPVRRSGRRLAWLDQALAPERPQLGEERFNRLKFALLPYLGIEAFVALVDVGGCSPDEFAETAVWAARSLLRASLAECADVEQNRRSHRTKPAENG